MVNFKLILFAIIFLLGCSKNNDSNTYNCSLERLECFCFTIEGKKILQFSSPCAGGGASVENHVSLNCIGRFVDTETYTYDLDFSFDIQSGQIYKSSFRLNHIPLKITKLNLTVDQYIEDRLINGFFDAEIYDDVQKLTYKINSGFFQTRNFF